MAEREFFRWQVRAFTVRVALSFIDALGRKLSAANSNPEEEVGGVLLGSICSSEEIEISDFEFFPSGHRRGIIYSLGLREQLSLAEHVARMSGKSGLKPVGFFRTHLRRGLFLDQDDFSLMQEAFGDPAQVALLIRPLEPGLSSAGIFAWEEGDIDRRQTELLFPFNSNTLRVQGPIEAVPMAETKAVKPQHLHTVPLRRMVLGAATLAGMLTLAAIVPKGHFRLQSDVPPKPPVTAPQTEAAPSAPQPRVSDPPSKTVMAEVRPIPAPQPYVAPRPDEGKTVTPGEPKPAETKPVAAPRPVVAVLAPPVPVPAVRPTVTDPMPAPDLSPSRPAPPPPLQNPVLPKPALQDPAPPKTAPKDPAVHVAVSLEPRQASEMKKSELKKVVSHVPLFGHLARADSGNGFSPAYPDTPLEPRVPSSLASGLSGPLAVDVRLTIDKHGLVTNSQVLYGAGTQFAYFAARNAGSASWEPAREGDRSVASDIIVHYRFQSAH